MYKNLKIIFFLLTIYFITNPIFANNAKSIAYDFYQKGEKAEKALYAFEARDDFRKAIALDPNNAGYLTHYAWFLNSFKFLQEATVAFKCALANPQGQDVKTLYEGSAWSEFYMGNLAQSLCDFKHLYCSHWLNTNYTNAFITVGRIVGAEYRYKIWKLKLKLACDPNNFTLQKELFDDYRYYNKDRLAIALGRCLMANSKTDNLTRLEFARTLYKAKRYKEAELQYHLLMQCFPRNAYLSFEWGTKLMELRKYEAACQMFKQSLEYYPSAEAKAALARLLACKGCCDSALNLLSDIPNKCSTVYLLGAGDVYRSCCQYQKANSYYQAVLQQYPYNTAALWGVLSSTACHQHYNCNRIAYDRWQEVYYWNRSFLQSELVDYYQSPMFLLNGDYYDNSITFRRTDTGPAYDFYAGHNSRVNISYAYSSFAQDWFNTIYRNMFQILVSKQFTEHWQVLLGISDKAYTNDYNNINGNFAVRYTAKKGNATLEYKHLDIIDTEPPFGILIYNYIVTIGAVGLNIQTNDYSGTFYYQATERFSLWGRAVYGKYTDGNTKTQANFEAKYQIIDVPNVKLIYNFFYLNLADPAPLFFQNDHSTSAYYDPRNLQVHTGKIRIEHYFRCNLLIGIEDGVSFFPQNSSFANAIRAYMDWKMCVHLGMRLDAQYYNQAETVTRTNVHGNPFWAKAVTLSLIYKI